jgi:hypothetical protein
MTEGVGSSSSFAPPSSSAPERSDPSSEEGASEVPSRRARFSALKRVEGEGMRVDIRCEV